MGISEVQKLGVDRFFALGAGWAEAPTEIGLDPCATMSREAAYA